MRDEFEVGIPENLKNFAERLVGWQPTAGNLDRDRLLYEAGREAGLAEARAMFRRRFWPMTAVAASLLALSVGLLITRAPDREQPTSRVDVVKGPRPDRAIGDETPIAPADPNSYLALSRRIGAGSLDSIPTDRARTGSAPSNPVDSLTPLRTRDLDRLLNL